MVNCRGSLSSQQIFGSPPLQTLLHWPQSAKSLPLLQRSGVFFLGRNGMATNLPDNLTPEQQTLLRLRDDPSLFVRNIIGAEPQEWQQRALNLIRDNDRVSIVSGHGTGKTTYLAWLCLWWLTTRHPVKIAMTANTANQLSDVLMGEIANWTRRMHPAFRDQLEFRADKISLKGSPDSAVYARVSRKEQPESLQGFHSPNMLFIIDEASGVPDIIFEVGQGSLSTPGAKIVMTGNPTRTSGFFWASHNTQAHRWATMRVSCMDADTVRPEFIEEMREMYGEDSNQFRIRVLGEFGTADDDTIIPAHLVDAAIARDVEPIAGIQPVWGLDVARFGADRTALAKRRGNTLIEPIKSWQDKDLMQICGIVLQEYDACSYDDRPSEILVDVIGLGAGVVDRLREMDFCEVRGINVSKSAALNEKYVRQRDELWFRLREWLEARDCSMPADDLLKSELVSPRFSFQSNGKLKVESKDQMKRRGMRSPDLADALVLTFAGTAARASSGRTYSRGKTLYYPNLKQYI